MKNIAAAALRSLLRFLLYSLLWPAACHKPQPWNCIAQVAFVLHACNRVDNIPQQLCKWNCWLRPIHTSPARPRPRPRPSAGAGAYRNLQIKVILILPAKTTINASVQYNANSLAFILAFIALSERAALQCDSLHTNLCVFAAAKANAHIHLKLELRLINYGTCLL